jgi:hypothetical protein
MPAPCIAGSWRIDLDPHATHAFGIRFIQVLALVHVGAAESRPRRLQHAALTTLVASLHVAAIAEARRSVSRARRGGFRSIPQSVSGASSIG